MWLWGRTQGPGRAEVTGRARERRGRTPPQGAPLILGVELPAHGELTPSQTHLAWPVSQKMIYFIEPKPARPPSTAGFLRPLPDLCPSCHLPEGRSLFTGPASFPSKVAPQLGLHSRPSVQSGRAPARAAGLGCLTPHGRLLWAGKEPAAWAFGGDLGVVGGDNPVPSVSAQGLLPTPPGSSGLWEPGTVRVPRPSDGAT